MRVVDEVLAQRLEEAEAAHWGSLLEGMAGNPYGAEVRRFGKAVALVCPGMPRRSFVNRVLLADSPDELDAAVQLFRDKGLRCRVDVTPYQANKGLLSLLHEMKFRQMGFQTALYLEDPQGPVPSFDIRMADTAAQQKFAAEALPIAFGETSDTWIRWLTDSMGATFDRPDWKTYIAYVAGIPAAFAQLHLTDLAGCLALAGTLPLFRGYGAQTALIQRRIADAVAAGCDLVCTQTGSGTVSQHNMERNGFRIAYTKAEFYSAPE